MGEAITERGTTHRAASAGAGMQVSGKQDLHRAVVVFAEPAGMPGGLRPYGGLPIALLGIGRWAIAMRHRRTPDEESDRRAGQEQTV